MNEYIYKVIFAYGESSEYYRLFTEPGEAMDFKKGLVAGIWARVEILEMPKTPIEWVALANDYQIILGEGENKRVVESRE